MRTSATYCVFVIVRNCLQTAKEHERGTMREGAERSVDQSGQKRSTVSLRNLGCQRNSVDLIYTTITWIKRSTAHAYCPQLRLMQKHNLPQPAVLAVSSFTTWLGREIPFHLDVHVQKKPFVWQLLSTCQSEGATRCNWLFSALQSRNQPPSVCPRTAS